MEWIDLIVKVVVLVLGAVVVRYVVPWLKEKNLYETVQQMVQAAEKWAENNNIDKKAWVVEKLKAQGIEVNEYVDALIESAVKELDIAVDMSKNPDIDELLLK